MFSCMAGRAVHIEIIQSLDSDSIMQAIRRVIICRRNITILCLGNGTNLTRCANKVKKACKEIENEKIQSFMESFGVDLLRSICWNLHGWRLGEVKTICPSNTVFPSFKTWKIN